MRLTRAIVAALVAGAVATPAVAATAAADERPASGGDPTAGAVIWEWNEVAMSVLTPSGRPLLTQPFVTAAMHVAMYDAVMAIEGAAEPFHTAVKAPEGASPVAAAAAAAHRVLVGFLPDSAAVFAAALEQSLADVPDGQGELDGIAVGEAAGWGTLAARLHDGSQTGPIPPARPPGDGVWAPTPPNTVGLAPWLAVARPYGLRSPDQFRPSGPPALTSGRWRRDLDEVRRLGGSASTERTADQTTVARFWADQPIAQNQRTLRTKAMQLGWGLAPTARLFAAVMTAEVDTITACWDAKYHYQFWRPWQAVPTVETGWAPLLGTPNHPEYPSAHGCLTGSLAYSLARVMGTDHIELDIHATNLGITRHYATVDDLLGELAEARIWGGLHYRFSTETGIRLAERVVRFDLTRNFRLTD